MAAEVVLLGFGEPPSADRSRVVAYLERIFLANAEIEADRDPGERARELAERRAPGLIDEYGEIGGSPLNSQLRTHADRLASTLADRGYGASTHVGFQFTEPFIEDAVTDAIDGGVDRLIGLPVYPLCGASTTIAALVEFREAIDRVSLEVPVNEITGWHSHPTYNRIRAENVREFVREHGIEFADDDSRLVFSAHGTPQHYLDAGSRYEQYVETYCRSAAALLGVPDYELGYQNHENRDVPWTEPAIEVVIEGLHDGTVVVEPVSFMHEQSETLSELDRDLRDEAESNGLAFHRVPVPHEDPRFAAVLADLVEPFLAGFDPSYYNLHRCLCRESPDAVCLNAARHAKSV